MSFNAGNNFIERRSKPGQRHRLRGVHGAHQGPTTARLRPSSSTRLARAFEADSGVHRAVPVPVSEPVLVLAAARLHAMRLIATGFFNPPL